MCATSLLVKRLTEKETFQSARSLLALYYKFQSLSCLCAYASLSGCVCVCMCLSTWKGRIFTTAIIYSMKNKLYLLGKNTLNKYFLFCFFQTEEALEYMLATFSCYSFHIKGEHGINQRAAELNLMRVLCLSLCQKLHLLLCRLCNQWIPLMYHFCDNEHNAPWQKKKIII